MRLLDTKTLKFRDFYQIDIPPYAILSHTWGDEEVVFQEMSSRNQKLKKGFTKIKKTCDLAHEDGLDYAWVDTCCIDKSSSAELTEAINSMYQWYSEADLCYVYLEDLLSGGLPEGGRSRNCWPQSTRNMSSSMIWIGITEDRSRISGARSQPALGFGGAFSIKRLLLRIVRYQRECLGQPAEKQLV